MQDRSTQFEREMAQALEQEQQRLRQRIQDLVRTGRLLAEGEKEESGAGGQAADVASDLLEHELDVSLEHATRLRLAEVEAALARLRSGRYGRCETCGQPIDQARLRALPWTRQCVSCAKAVTTVPQASSAAEKGATP